MSRADTFTFLSLDDYAIMMGINRCSFNQVVWPNWPAGAECPDVWYQFGYPNANEVVGREDLAIAIHLAEDMIANALGYHLAPTWDTLEEHAWPYPAQGNQIVSPFIQTNWGYVISGGVRNMTTIALAQPVVYSDPDGDTYNELATITLTNAQMVTAGAVAREVRVYFHDQNDDTWEIRPLTIVRNAVTGIVTITGSTCQFVTPVLWDAANPTTVDISVVGNFVTEVDVYRVWNDTSTQAEIVYKDGCGVCECSTTPCEETCQDGCIIVQKPRPGIVKVNPANYLSSVWTSSVLSFYPSAVRLNYLSGLPLEYDKTIRGDGHIRPLLAEAVVRLANTLLPAQPCGCGLTVSRWRRDRIEQEINSVVVATAANWFGSTMAGAVFASNVVRNLNPLGRASTT